MNMENRNKLYKLRVLHGIIYEKKHQIITLIKRKMYYRLPLSRKAFVIGMPVHKNIGDSAIALAEVDFISKCGLPRESIKEITMEEYKQYLKIIKRSIGRKDIICLLGGGNMGDVWLKEETFRRQILIDFKKQPIIVFPQTVDYSDSLEGRQEWEKSKDYYNNQRLTLIAREQQSFELMKSAYPNAKVIATPDIVLSSCREDYGAKEQEKRDGILFCMRSDKEKSMSDDLMEEIKKFVVSLKYKIIETDMYSSEYIWEQSVRKTVVCEKMEEFAKAELVITDRLHAMIFSALTETPCIAFSNSNYKVKGTYEWIKYLPYIKFVNTTEEAKKYIPILLQMKTCRFDNRQLTPYFKEIENIIKARL